MTILLAEESTATFHNKKWYLHNSAEFCFSISERKVGDVAFQVEETASMPWSTLLFPRE